VICSWACAIRSLAPGTEASRASVDFGVDGELIGVYLLRPMSSEDGTARAQFMKFGPDRVMMRGRLAGRGDPRQSGELQRRIARFLVFTHCARAGEQRRSRPASPDSRDR
jgi:hypothetical protein